MSVTGLFEIGKSALFASQTALSTISHNIANVNTPGYSRQDVILQVATPVPAAGGLLGRGVTVAGIKRNYDSFVQAQLLGQTENYGRSEALSQFLGQIEQVFNDSMGIGLSDPLMQYFNAWNEVSSTPDSRPQRLLLLQKAGFLASVAGQMESDINSTIKQMDDGISTAVSRINNIAQEISALNGQIAQVEGGGGSDKAYDLRDRRDVLLSELSELAENSTYEEDNGSVTVTIGMRNLVNGERVNTLSAQPNQDNNYDLMLDGVNITEAVSGGKLGGMIAAREDTKATALTDLRRLIASLTKEVNLLHTTGFGLDGSTGNNFFNPLQLATTDRSAGAGITASVSDLSQLTLDEYDITFDAAATNYTVTDRQTGAAVATGVYATGTPITFEGIEVTITGTIAAGDSFAVSPLTDAIKNFGVAVTDPDKVAASATAAGIPGDNTVALQLAQMAAAPVSSLGGATISGYYAEIVAEVGAKSKTAADTLAFDESLLTSIEGRRESISGVSLDEEAANMLRYQRSYEAAARLITVTDELMQTILDM